MEENSKKCELSEESRRRRQLFRQKARTENDFDEGEMCCVLLDSPTSPSRIIYKETIDISSPGVSPGPEWQAKSFVYGSVRYLAKQGSAHSYNSLNSGRVTSPHSYPSIGWKHLRKQRSMTVEKSSFSSSPSSPPPPSPRSSSPASPSLRSSSPQSPGHQLNKKKYEKSVCCNSQFSTQEKLFSHSKPAPSSPWSGSARHLAKQYSCTSNSSAYLSPQLATVTFDSNPKTKINKDPVPVKAIKKPPSKTKWTLFCIAMGFLTVCIVLVGTMLSYTSAYQDREVARNMFYNVANTTNY